MCALFFFIIGNFLISKLN